MSEIVRRYRITRKLVPMVFNVDSVSETELAGRLDASVLEASPETVRVQIPVKGNTQPFGILHGGANGFLVEDAGSRLALLNAPEGKGAAGTELSVSHVKANSTDLATARARVIARTRSTIVIAVDIDDADGHLTATGRLTCVFVPLS